jgi:hypothetical protein
MMPRMSEAGMQKRAAIYVRVSTDRQTIENQLRELRQIAVDNHNVDFRGSPDFQEWRKLVGHCFAAAPQVEHVQQILRGF